MSLKTSSNLNSRNLRLFCRTLKPPYPRIPVAVVILTLLVTTLTGQPGSPGPGTALPDITTPGDSVILRVTQQALTEDYRLVIQQPLVINLPVAFPPGSASLPAAVKPDLERIAEFLNWRQDTRLEIVAYVPDTPSSTTPSSTIMALSAARADSVRSWIERKTGQTARRILSTGGGTLENTAAAVTNTLLVFKFIEAEKITRPQDLKLRITISVPESVNLDRLRLHCALPPGWTYLSKSGLVNGRAIEPQDFVEDELIWDLTSHLWLDPIMLDLSLIPAGYRQIASISVFSSFLEFMDPQQNHVITGTLFSRVPTRVNETTFRIIVPGATFAVNSWEITPELQKYLANLGQFLRWQEDIEVTIEGYTDNTGQYQTNLDLSEKRAHSVQEFLKTAYGIAAGRMQIKGMGPQFPTAANATAAGRAENRRIEFLVNSDFQQTISGESAHLSDELIHPLPLAPAASEIIIIPVPGSVQDIAPNLRHRLAGTIHTGITAANIGIIPALEKIASVMDSLDLSDSGCNTDSCLRDIGRALGATRLVQWSLSRENEQYHMVLRYLDLSADLLLLNEKTIQYSGDSDSLVVVVQQGVHELLTPSLEPSETPPKPRLKTTYLVGGIVIALVGAGIAIAVTGPGPEAPPAGIGFPPDWPEP